VLSTTVPGSGFVYVLSGFCAKNRCEIRFFMITYISLHLTTEHQVENISRDYWKRSRVSEPVTSAAGAAPLFKLH